MPNASLDASVYDLSMTLLLFCLIALNFNMILQILSAPVGSSRTLNKKLYAKMVKDLNHTLLVPAQL